MSKKNYCPAGMEDDEEDEIDRFSGRELPNIYKSMKITIVPEITSKAGLNGEDFDARLDPEVSKWFATYKDLWNTYKKTPAMVEMLRKRFISSQNPLLLVLKLYANCSNTRTIRKSCNLDTMILEQIAIYKSENPNISQLCNDNMRMVAFNFAKMQGSVSVKAVNDAYELGHIKVLLEPKVRELIAKNYYKEASQLAIALNLTEKFGIYDIPFPLLLQDKISVAEEYLDIAKHLQKPVIELLDSLLDRTVPVSLKCDPYIAKYNYTDVKMEKLLPKPITKLIVRLVRKYDLPTDCTPNVNRSKNIGYMQHLVHRKYVDKTLNSDSWREMIKDLVSDNFTELGYELIASITANQDLEEAAYFVQFFKMDVSELPEYLQHFIQISRINIDELSHQIEKDSVNACGVSPVTDKNFYQLNMDEEDIVFVQDETVFNAMIAHLQSVSVVAFDSEWKSTKAGNRVCLIQLAAGNCGYLVDALSSNISKSCWSKLGHTIFNNDEILKIGFSLNNDIFVMQKSLPSLNLCTQSLLSYLDLQNLARKLQNINNFSFPFANSTTGEKLADLVEHCFGKKLDKSNQFSNWERRPLQRDQIVYAALDAYCLLEIYYVIRAELEKIDVNVDDFLESFIADYNSQRLNSRSKRKSKRKYSPVSSCNNESQMPSEPNPIPVRAIEVKFICDNMLDDLVRHLRKLGIDAILVPNGERSFNTCLKIALKDNRYVLTRFLDDTQLQNRIENVINLKSHNLDEQVFEIQIKLNLILKEEDIFSRCQICNSNEFLLALRADLKKLKYNRPFLAEKNLLKNHNPVKKSCVLRKITEKNIKIGRTNKGAKIQIDLLSSYHLDSLYYFYICEGCGKCYWDGEQVHRILNGPLKNIFT